MQLASWGVTRWWPNAKAKCKGFHHLFTTQALGNVLVVAPTALLGLVDGSLRISHSAALNFIRLREDFKTARLPGGVSLADVFAED